MEIRNLKKLIPLAFALALTGCATSAVSPSEALSAPSERVMKYSSQKAGDSPLTIIRDSGHVGSACYATVFINGERSAKLDTSEKVTFFLPAGQWVIGTALEGAGLCSYGNGRQEREVTLSNATAKSLRIFTDASGNMDIKPTTLD